MLIPFFFSILRIRSQSKLSPDFFFHINHSIPFLQKQGNFDNPKDLLRILVTVHTPLSREVFWHEYAKIPRHTRQNSIAAGNLE